MTSGDCLKMCLKRLLCQVWIHILFFYDRHPWAALGLNLFPFRLAISIFAVRVMVHVLLNDGEIFDGVGGCSGLSRYLKFLLHLPLSCFFYPVSYSNARLFADFSVIHVLPVQTLRY